MSFRGGPVLGIESSCDETSAAVVSEGRVTGHVILSQDAHAVFGGVVPEVASRAHLEAMLPTLETALQRGGVRLAGPAQGLGSQRAGQPVDVLLSIQLGGGTDITMALQYAHQLLSFNNFAIQRIGYNHLSCLTFML